MVDTTRFDPGAGERVKKQIRRAGKKAAKATKATGARASRVGQAAGEVSKAVGRRVGQVGAVAGTAARAGVVGGAALGATRATAEATNAVQSQQEQADAIVGLSNPERNRGFFSSITGDAASLRRDERVRRIRRALRFIPGGETLGNLAFGEDPQAAAARANSEAAVADAAGAGGEAAAELEARPVSRLGQPRVQRVSPESVLQPGAEVGQFGDPTEVVQPGTGIIQNNTTGASTGLRTRPGAAAQPVAAETAQEDLPFGQQESSVRRPRSFLGALSAQNQLSRSRVRADNRSRLGREQAVAATEAARETAAADADRALEERKVRIEEANSASERQTALLEARSGIREALADPDQADSVKQALLQDVIDGNDVTGEGRNILLAEIADQATVFGALTDLDFGTAFDLATNGRPPFDVRDLQVDNDGNIKVGGRKITETDDLSSQAQQALNVLLANQQRPTLRR